MPCGGEGGVQEAGIECGGVKEGGIECGGVVREEDIVCERW